MAPSDTRPLLDLQALLDQIEDSSPLILDCGKREEYERAHIPSAAHIGCDYWLKEPDSDGGFRGPFLMSVERLSSLFGSLGINRERQVVTYDDNGGRGATRVWWVLRYLGHQKVSVLEGGWRAWLDGVGTASCSEPSPSPTLFQPDLDTSMLATREAVQRAAEDEVQLVDARSADEWSGADLHGNERGGHIPSARHLEWRDLITEEQPWRFRPVEEMRAIARDSGIDPAKPIVTYCQGGVRAAHLAFALMLVGCENVSVYDGSMREWANRADTEIVSA